MTAKKTAAPAKGAALPKTTTARKAAAKKIEAEAAPVEAIQESSAPAESAKEGISSLPAPKGVCVVIPYKANAAKGKELVYAIRAWNTFYPGVQIVLIGDTLPELNDQVLHIPHKPVSDNPQIDVAHKMATAIASELVPEVFVWSNDDIYCVSEIVNADLEIFKATKDGLSASGAAGGVYRENALRTLKALASIGIEKPHNYGTHTPVVFEKKKLAETLAVFKCTKEGHLVSSLYFNSHFPTIRPIIVNNNGTGSFVASVFRSDANPEVIEAIFQTQKWVNNNDKGWTAVEPYLAEMFREKSKFEK